MSEDTEQVSTWALVGTNDKRAADRRRRWPVALKRQIVAETREPGASVSVVARRHDVNANQVFKWRRQYEAGCCGGGSPLVAVALRPQPAAPGGTIEIDAVSGARVRISGAVDAAALRQVLERLL